MRKNRTETPSVQSLDRGLLILEAVAKSSDPVSLDQLARLLNIDRSSVFRLANTLKRRGFLTYPSRRKDYILGSSIWRLARHYNWGTTLAQVCHSHLQELANKVGETAHLAVLEGKRALFIDCVKIDHVISVSGQTGELVPLYCTAHGKALLSDFTLKDLSRFYNRSPLHRFTPRTVVSIKELATLCALIREQGYATDDGEFQEGLRCVAAPIRDEERTVVGSIGISAPLARFPKKRCAVVAEQVTKIALQASELLRARSD